MAGQRASGRPEFEIRGGEMMGRQRRSVTGAPFVPRRGSREACGLRGILNAALLIWCFRVDMQGRIWAKRLILEELDSR